jgi:small subunit ribosomal protein S6
MGYKTKRNRMNNYETLFVLKPTLTEEEMNANIAKVKTTLEQESAKILAIDEMGMRRLAYPVAKYERGFYVIIYYNAEGSIISEFERKLKFNEDVIKFLTVRYSNRKEVAQFEKLIAKATKNMTSETKEEASPKVEETQEA